MGGNASSQGSKGSVRSNRPSKRQRTSSAAVVDPWRGEGSEHRSGNADEEAECKS